MLIPISVQVLALANFTPSPSMGARIPPLPQEEGEVQSQ